MSDTPPSQPAGWYHAQGDPPDTQRYWDGSQWQGGPQPRPPTAASTGAGSGDLASPGQRLLARLIDWAVWITISMVLALVLGGGRSTVGTEVTTGASLIAGVISTLLIIAYEVWFVANKGGTPGKLVLGLAVADAATRATPVDYATSVKRVVPILIQFVPVLGPLVSLAIGLISVVLIFSDRQRQTIWDKIAGTVVVRTR